MLAVLGMLWTVLSGVTLVTVNDSIETLCLNSNLISLMVWLLLFFWSLCIIFISDLP